MDKYTKGPWQKSENLDLSINCGKKHIAMVNFYQSVDVDANVDAIEAEANFNLILQSPKLLEALEQIVNLVHIKEEFSDDHYAIKQAIDVIQKAQGSLNYVVNIP